MMSKMNRTIILTGRENSDENIIETYQLLIDCNYFGGEYHVSKSREEFYDEICREFAQRIEDERLSLQLGVLNGHRIDSQRRFIPAERIEDEHIKQFIRTLKSKLNEMERILSIPISRTN